MGASSTACAREPGAPLGLSAAARAELSLANRSRRRFLVPRASYTVHQNLCPKLHTKFSVHCMSGTVDVDGIARICTVAMHLK